MKDHKQFQQTLHQVPVDYYQQGTKKNLLQKLWHRGKLKAVINLVDVKPTTILDVGCASGWFLSEISRKFPTAKCTGIDLYKDAVEYGKKQYPKLNLMVGNAQKLPFNDKRFDLVICTEVVEHVEDLAKLIAEIKRVLKPNGQAIIEVDSGNWLFRFTWWLWTKLKGQVWHEAHTPGFRIEDLEARIKKAGLKIQKKKFFNLRMAVAYRLRV